MRQLLPRGLLTPLGRLADPSVPYTELTREFGVVGLVLSNTGPSSSFQDGAPRRGEAFPLLGVKARSLGSDCLSLRTVNGRLALFAHQWEIITNDLFILSVVAHGFKRVRQY